MGKNGFEKEDNVSCTNPLRLYMDIIGISCEWLRIMQNNRLCLNSQPKHSDLNIFLSTEFYVFTLRSCTQDKPKCIFCRTVEIIDVKRYILVEC